ncbi:hypothetical protein ACCO45_000101 [Purpureocillium lilacinum]|uniref:Uncharacterized protein n=1 Tax=Purpureocillium lilacinum TaxID=33203 RepID=A0ACC4E3A2_PURLI
MAASTGDNPNAPRGEPAPELLDGRIWVDGCFDFFHHGGAEPIARTRTHPRKKNGRLTRQTPAQTGHAGAMVQARQLGDELYVGVHSDEDILANKGPTVMTLEERQAQTPRTRRHKRLPLGHRVRQPRALRHGAALHLALRLPVRRARRRHHLGLGRQRLLPLRQAGRPLQGGEALPRHLHDGPRRPHAALHQDALHPLLQKMLAGQEGYGSPDERRAQGEAMLARLRLYATDETAKAPGAEVWFWTPSPGTPTDAVAGDENGGSFERLLAGKGPLPGQRVVYVDGGYDLFSSGHIEFLRRVGVAEEELARGAGWFDEAAVARRKASNGGKDYGPAFVVVGVHEDEVINEWKGVNYPIMNIFERGLCVLQCKYINAVVFGAPFTPTKAYLSTLPFGGVPAAIYHGPTAFMPLTYDPYEAPKAMGIYREIGAHAFSEVNAGQIVQRIMRSRDMYEARQRAKGVKAEAEAAAREREVLEEEQRRREAERRA